MLIALLTACSIKSPRPVSALPAPSPAEALPASTSPSGGVATEAEPPPPPPEIGAPPLADEIWADYARGREAQQSGDLVGARVHFDRAVDSLLDRPGGALAQPETRELYDKLVKEIAAIEREALGRGASLAELPVRGAGPHPHARWAQGCPASVDELGDTVESLPDERALLPLTSPFGDFALPLDSNDRVAAVVRLFQGKKREWFEATLRRSGRYLPHIRDVFRKEGLPPDLAYLAMVESAFKPHALSRAGARGMWQFMSGTARLYGLERDFWIDERADPEKATHAAARHLKDLYRDFGDWYLAMAAYNAGAGKVEKAITRARTRDFWELSRTRYLRRETKSYVPMILAATVISKDASRYGFEVELDSPLRYDVARLDAPADLRTLAECAGTSVDQLLELNPELRRMTTPGNRPAYALKIPAGALDRFSGALAAIPPEKRVRFQTHLVAKGETLSGIARRYQVTVSGVAEANGLGRNRTLRPGDRLVIPVAAPVETSSRLSLTYLVRRGDTLSTIARRFEVTVRQLREWNKLPGDRITAGDALTIYSSSP